MHRVMGFWKHPRPVTALANTDTDEGEVTHSRSSVAGVYLAKDLRSDF